MPYMLFYCHMYIHIYVCTGLGLSARFGRKVPAVKNDKKVKLCLWKRSSPGLLMGDWHKRKKKETQRERERERQNQNPFFFFLFFFACPPPPGCSQVIKPVLETWEGGRGHAKKTKKKWFWIFVVPFLYILSPFRTAFSRTLAKKN